MDVSRTVDISISTISPRETIERRARPRLAVHRCQWHPAGVPSPQRLGWRWTRRGANMRSDKDSVDRAVKLLRDSGIGSIEDLARKAADEALRTGSSVEEVLGGRTVIPDQAPPMR